MTIDQWLDVPHTLIGSRAFDIEHADSDYDIVILLKDLPKFFRNRINTVTDNSVKRYFNLIPCHGRGWVLKDGNTELFTKDILKLDRSAK